MTDGRLPPCRIYGVLDLQAGDIVHATGGRRATYQPVRSRIVASAAPRDVAQAFVQQLGLRAAYVADLDALAGHPPNLAALATIADAGLDVLIDAGCADAERARALTGFRSSCGPLAGIAVALETLPDAALLAELVQTIGAERAVLSLDLLDGRPLARCQRLAGCRVEQIAELAWQAGVRRLLVLDLAAVGSGAGPMTVETCRRLSQRHAWDELISGGGVRHAADVAALAQAGCHGVLAGTALHTGALSRSELSG
ncbi:MAG: HisA/HisF-related TIM barrel protein [Pirellulaceae bacterium]|nr:HisA/HisF-related TIM barrel protein [Pirellulaceae bacterium]